MKKIHPIISPPRNLSGTAGRVGCGRSLGFAPIAIPANVPPMSQRSRRPNPLTCQLSQREDRIVRDHIRRTGSSVNAWLRRLALDAIRTEPAIEQPSPDNIPPTPTTATSLHGWPSAFRPPAPNPSTPTQVRPMFSDSPRHRGASRIFFDR